MSPLHPLHAVGRVGVVLHETYGVDVLCCSFDVSGVDASEEGFYLLGICHD